MSQDATIAINASVHAIRKHGIGRTPASMLLLDKRLRSEGIKPHLFAYSAAFERWQPCVDRLQRFLNVRSGDERCIVIGHSLGCVLTRAVLPQLAQAPQMCIFLAPWPPFMALSGKMGKFLGSHEFMVQVPLRIYAGIKGPRGGWLSFGDELSDGYPVSQQGAVGRVSNATASCRGC